MVKAARGICKAPKLSRWSVAIWQSMKATTTDYQGPAQVDQGHLGGLADEAEHGFSKKNATIAEFVKAAVVVAILPDLHWWGATSAMEPLVSANRHRHQPGAVAVMSQAGTGAWGLMEGFVQGDLKKYARRGVFAKLREIWTIRAATRYRVPDSTRG